MTTPRTLGNGFKSGLGAARMHLPGRDDGCAVVSRRVQFSRARAANRPHADLHDACDMSHLAGAPHRAGIPKALAMDFVAPVDMGVDLQDPDWPGFGKSRKKGNGNGIVAADHHRDGCGGKDCACRRFDQGAIGGIAARARGEISGINATGGLICEQGAIKIKIPVFRLDRRLPGSAARISRAALAHPLSIPG